MKNILLYGANGFTGRLILKRCIDKGLKPIVAGRNAEEIQRLSDQYGLEHRVFSLAGKDEILKGLEGIDVLIHAAGPFMFTSRPMLEACLRSKTHYLDITGEIEVFEMCASNHEKAKQAHE